MLLNYQLYIHLTHLQFVDSLISFTIQLKHNIQSVLLSNFFFQFHNRIHYGKENGTSRSHFE